MGKMNLQNDTILPTNHLASRPALQPLPGLLFEEPKPVVLANGANAYAFDAGAQEIVQCAICFPASAYFTAKPLESVYAGRMIFEGTAKRSAQEIADAFARYGISYGIDSDRRLTSITVTTLTRFLEPALTLLYEVITEAAYPQSELGIAIKNAMQRLAVNRERVAYLAQEHFESLIFGADHPTGKIYQPADYEQIDSEVLKAIHQEYLQIGNSFIVAAGRGAEEAVALWDKLTANDQVSSVYPSRKLPLPNPSGEKKAFIPKADAMQNALRVGFELPAKTHPDAMPMRVLNTIFGGYFGSRLMSNLREDKGFTYGVGSSVAFNENRGMLTIGTEVGAEVSEAALTEIYREMEILKTDLVSKEELETVQKYMHGKLLSRFDGPFALADTLRGVLERQETFGFYAEMLDTIYSTTPEKLRTLAETYFHDSQAFEVVAGSR